MREDFLAPEVSAEVSEQIRRDLIVAFFSTLKVLSLHNSKNEALQRPLQLLARTLSKLSELYPGQPLEITYEESVVSILGQKVLSHFSISEALNYVTDALDGAMIESILFAPHTASAQLGEFFSAWTHHCSIHLRAKPLSIAVEGIEVKSADSERSYSRLKNKSMLLSPSYALENYYLLKVATEEVFKSVRNNQLISQKKLRRGIMEIVDIAGASPYQLVALSLIREENVGDPVSSAVNQALASSMLSIVLAKELLFSVREQINIGLIGLLYNVGMVLPQADAAMKNDRLTPIEYKRLLDAQTQGVYTLLKGQGTSRPVLERLLAIFEQSRASEMKSVSLTIESRLLRLVSQYVALTNERPFRDSYTPVEAIKILGSKALTSTGADLDPILYYLFIRQLGVYPVGSLCLLSTGGKAIVYRPSGEKNGTPMLKILNENHNEPAKLVDLAHSPEIKILKILDPKREGIRVAPYFFE